MKRLLLLLVFSLPGLAQPQDCRLCIGLAGQVAPGAPTLVTQSVDSLQTIPSSPGATVVIEYGAASGVEDIESKTAQVVEWAKSYGPFDGIGVSVETDDSALAAYAVKRLAVQAQGAGIAQRVVLPRSMSLQSMFEHSANGYFDVVLADAADVGETFAWLAERDPLKRIYAVVEPQSPNPLFDLAKALSDGATRAYFGGDIDIATVSAFNRSMSGDWAFDSTARIAVLDARGTGVQMPVLTFVRGEDLRKMFIPRGDSGAPFILALSGDSYAMPKRVTAEGEIVITDMAQSGGRLLIGSPAGVRPNAILAEHVEPPPTALTKETVDVASERTITVEEIIRNHQAYDAWQESIEPRYTARNTTSLRFDIGGGAEALEASIAGPYFSDPAGRSDWVWEDFYINGVKWKYGRIPELPLIQPEKVSQLPLDLHLSNDYRYELVRATDLRGHRVWEVRFEPPPNAPESLPLYRGTVWIDAKSWARIRISMVQLNLTGEVLSNEERVDFIPYSRSTGLAVSAEEAVTHPRSVVWLPYEVTSQQVISAAGRASVIQKSTRLENVRLDPDDFDQRLAAVSASDARMVRETDAGLRYLEKRDGERVVKEGYDTARLFMVGGIHHDSGLDYPVVPLGGIDYFNFDLGGRGIQTNVFFAGLVLAANATHPNVGGTRTNVGADFFGIAIPFQNEMYRDGEKRPEESIKTRPMGLYLRAGHPFLDFGKIDVALGISHHTYQRGDDTDPDFIVPSSTTTFSPGVDLKYARRGYTFSASWDYNRRSTWEPWGNLAEFDPAQQTFTRFGASVGKSFYLPRFQRLSVDFNYLDGTNLDRFSKYELGVFGAQRVHGVRSGSVHAERAMIAHLSYGLVFSEQFRIEGFYDHAILDDEISGLNREPFQGVGIAGQTIGPYGTLLRLDIGKMIGRNAQGGFVANVVFLKLF
jgi:hypothetical protein